jgi:hypothetical protein
LWVVATIALAVTPAWERLTQASPPVQSTLEGTTSDAARHNAIHSIPFDKLSPEDRSKVEEVVANASIFRRMPVKVVGCDPDLYLFLVRHPDVVVNIWELMKVSQLQLRQLDDNEFMLSESVGTSAKFGLVYQSHDMHVFYGEGTYQGTLIPRPVKGRGVLVLKCGYVRETDGRYYITSRLDCFISIAPVGAELISKTVSPLVGKTVDNNFVQTLAFVGSLSRTAEVNDRGVRHLATKLAHVHPDVRVQFAEVAADIGQKSGQRKAAAREDKPEVAARASDAIVR